MIKDNQRGNGIGFQLLDKLIKIAQDEQIRRLSWLVYDWNTRAIEFYRKSGATVAGRLLTMQIENKIP